MFIIKKKNTIKIYFSNSEASEHVTGSLYRVYSDNINILLECGMSQSNNLENDYRTNLRKFNFKVRDIQYVFIGHTHLDHVGLLPLLVKRGLECPIIVPDGARRILKDMLTDSAMILYKEAETLSLRRNKIVEPVYTINDVNAALQLVEEFPFDKVIKLNDHIKFRYVNSGHIICGAQIEL